MRYSIVTLIVIILSSLNQIVISQENIVTHTIFFSSDKYEIPITTIDSLLFSWNLNSRDTLQLSAYCDSDGSEVYNMKLAERRLQFVLSRLDKGGFKSSNKKIEKNVFGESNPKFSNTSEGNKRKNRRVDISYAINPISKSAKDSIVPKPTDNQAVLEIPKPSKLTEEILNQRIEESLKTGDNIALEDILFRPGLDVFQPYSMPTLSILFKVMDSRKDLMIEIQGHVCCVPDGQSDGNNYRNGSNHLSEDRAEAVKEYLVNLGIQPKRVKTRGFGGSRRLINPEKTEADMARNRRVEIKIISK